MANATITVTTRRDGVPILHGRYLASVDVPISGAWADTGLDLKSLCKGFSEVEVNIVAGADARVHFGDASPTGATNSGWLCPTNVPFTLLADVAKDKIFIK